METKQLISPHFNPNMMRYIRLLLFMIVAFGFTENLKAQNCSFTVDFQKICQDGTVKFTSLVSGGGSVTGYKWEFGNGQNNKQNQSNIGYVYPSPGTYFPKLTVYFSNGDSCVTTQSTQIDVFPKPTVKYVLAPNSKDTQCYEGNKFCLVDSSKADTINKSPITRRLILWDDGSLDTAGKNWPNGNILCHSYADPRAQSYTPRLVITDSNGCVVNFEIKNYLTVRGKIGPAFSTSYSLKCDSTDVTFHNTTNIATSDIEYFEWDFGDGTFYKSQTPPSQADLSKYWNNFVHWYKTQGPFGASLKVRSRFGCWDSFSVAKAGDNVNLELNPTVEEDTMCAAGNVLYFHNKTLFTPQPGASQVYWMWNHPPPNNIDSGAWNMAHSFPGCKYPTKGEVYIIAKTFYPPCLKVDTLKYIKLFGPSAAIESPPSGILIADSERHQCDVRDTVHFTNVSDTCTGLYRVEWYWDFDDNSNIYSSNDTAYMNYQGIGPKNDTLINGKQKLKNTNFSREWKPVHMYDSTESNERCHTPKFIMDGWFLKWDTVGKFMDTIHCHSENQVPLSLMNPNAKGLEVSGQQCLGPMPPYGISFKWSKTKPGCTQQYVSICFDSACCAFTPSGKHWDPACWSEQNTFAIPPWSPFPPWPTSYKRPYFKTCDDSTGWVTVGLVIHNSRGQTDSNVQIGKYKKCSDTVWYHHKLRFVNNQPAFGADEIDSSPFYVCPRGVVTFRMKQQFQDSIINIIWSWGDGAFTVDTIQRRPVYRRVQAEYDMYGNVTKHDYTSKYGDTDMISPRYHRYDKRGVYNVRVTMVNTDSCEQTGRPKRVIIGNSADVYYDPVYNCISNATVTFHHELHYYNKLGPPFESDFDTANFWADPTKNPYTGQARTKPPGGYETATWFFDDNINPTANGVGPNGQTVVHTFKRMGTYHTFLAFKDSMGCSDTVFSDVFVDSLSANFGMDKPVVACDQIVHFYDSSGVFGPCIQNNPNCTDKITDWLWDFGDNKVTSILQNPIHQYLYPGIYYVKLIVKSQIGCFDTIIKPIRVVGPAPKFNIIGDTTGCLPFKAMFKNTSDTICKEYTWSWGDNTNTFTKSDTDMYHVYVKEGVYDVYLTASGNVYDSTIGKWLTCSFTYPDSAHPIKVYVKATPPVAFKIPHRVCVNEKFPVILAPDSLYEKHYVYYGDSTQDTGKVYKNRYTNGADTLYHSYSKVGTYIVNYAPQYTKPPICFDSKYDTIEVTDVTADFDIDTIDAPLFRFTDKSTLNSVKWWWDFGDPSSPTNTATTKDASHDYGSVKGTFTIKLIVQSSDGCYDTIEKNIKIDYVVEVKIPNTFTPDGDGFNDEYYVQVKGLAKETENYRLYIYNQWGEKVFESTDTAVKWTGKNMNSGADCPTGTYYFNFYYKVRGPYELKLDTDFGPQTEVKYDDEKTKLSGFAKGTITLMRKEK